MNIAIAVIVVVAVFLMFGARLKQGARDSMFLIRSPRLGILNLKGDSARTMIAEDKEAISGPFSSVEESANTPPKCDVLFVYCDLTEDGRVVGTSDGLRDVIRDSGAYVAIVASENSSEACISAGKPTG